MSKGQDAKKAKKKPKKEQKVKGLGPLTSKK
jgi:hypothetical protein